MDRKKLTPSQAKNNLQQYCSYQERSHSEVKDKLYSFGLTTVEVENIVADLIAEDFLNEERFARAFARGKFRMKQWGRVKIRYELKMRRVSEYCIRKAMTEIDDIEYEQTLTKLYENKSDTLRNEKNLFVRKRKLLDYLSAKGYERDLVMQIINTKP